MKIANVKNKYKEEAVGKLKEKFGYENIFSVPKIEKVVVNSGVGRFEKENEKIKDIVETFRMITGQNPVMVKARKSISGFKVRQGANVGVKVTLRGKRMWDFIDKTVNITFPRTRDFQGIKLSSISSEGDLNIGIKEQIVFPEISPEEAGHIFSLQINIKTNARTNEEGEALFKALGFPLVERK